MIGATGWHCFSRHQTFGSFGLTSTSWSSYGHHIRVKSPNMMKQYETWMYDDVCWFSLTPAQFKSMSIYGDFLQHWAAAMSTTSFSRTKSPGCCVCILKAGSPPPPFQCFRTILGNLKQSAGRITFQELHFPDLLEDIQKHYFDMLQMLPLFQIKRCEGRKLALYRPEMT